MGTPVPRYAKGIVKSMRSDVAREQRKVLPSVDTAEVVSLKGGVQIRPSNGNIVYDEDDIFWNIDPAGVKVGDTVTLLRDPDENPIVTGLSDGMNPDPALHPTHVKLRNEFDRLKSSAATWKAPVNTVADLPDSGNKPGDVRLVGTLNRLYRWRVTSGVGSWVALGGSGGSGAEYIDDLLDVTITDPQVGDAIVFDGVGWVNQPVSAPVTDEWVDTTGDTMTGPLVMSPGTDITLPDAPVDPTDAVNKAYVDAAIAIALNAATTLVPTVVVTTPTYTATPNDQAILVNYCTGQAIITLPANHIMDKVYEIKDIGGCAAFNNHKIVSEDGDTIDGLAEFEMNMNWQSVTVISDGNNWFII
jgi:hypothetical protein